MTGWFEVDKEGLAKLVERRGKGVALLELLQNAWDAPGVTAVTVQITNKAVSVEDDSPDGFVNLAEAYTLFAPSKKVGDPEKRGRFNFGEKLAFALADKVVIASKTGGVRFDKRGRTRVYPDGRERGTAVTLFMAMAPGEEGQVLEQARRCLPPPEIRTTINGVVLAAPAVDRSVLGAMQTEVADEAGVLRLVTRETRVDFLPTGNKRAWLFEMGIPVVKLGVDEPWSVNVHQKIPLTMERDNVRPSYMRRIRELVLEHMGKQIHGEVARRPWVTAALAAAPAEVVRHVVTERFGKAVIADPSDREGENIAKAQGYTVVSGGSFSADAWAAVKAAGALLPAGQVTPSPKPFSEDGAPLKLVDREDWTRDMSRFSDFAWQVYKLVISDDGIFGVDFTLDKTWRFNAAYGGRRLTVNIGLLGASFFAPERREERIRLLIHELAHEYGHHLEEGYHNALERIGARLVEIALTTPSELET
jgi:hypothetical protein